MEPGKSWTKFAVDAAKYSLHEDFSVWLDMDAMNRTIDVRLKCRVLFTGRRVRGKAEQADSDETED